MLTPCNDTARFTILSIGEAIDCWSIFLWLSHSDVEVETQNVVWVRVSVRRSEPPEISRCKPARVGRRLHAIWIRDDKVAPASSGAGMEQFLCLLTLHCGMG